MAMPPVLRRRFEVSTVLEEGLNVRVCYPTVKIPILFQKQGQRLLEYFGAKEEDFISFKTNLLLTDAGKDPVKRAGLISDIMRSIDCYS